MLKINLLSENEMAQKSKNEKDGNVHFLTEKNEEKFQTFLNTNTTVVFSENQV